VCLVYVQFKRCENLPTKKQLQATIARLLNQPATKIATGGWACCAVQHGGTHQL